MRVPLAEWTPDLSPVIGDQTAENVIPEVDSYLPWNSATAYSNTISARAQGFIAAKDKAGVNYNYCGDNHDLYVLANQTWTVASRTPTVTYSTVSSLWWEFVQWNETVIATNYADDPQAISLGATNFAALAGSPPKAKHIAIVRDFVELGNIPDYPQRVRWSAINNAISWTVDATTQADYQDLVGEGGHVQKIIGGEYGVVFQERAIWRQTYVGSPLIFQFDQVEKNTGAFSPMACVGFGPAVFYLSEDGFKMFQGSGSVPIGAQKVDRTFFNDLDTAYVDRVNAVVDPKRKLYIVAYPGSGNTNGNCNKILVYNWQCKKWTLVSEDVEMLVRHISTGYSMDGAGGLDSVSGSLDALPASLDDPIWAGGLINIASFNTSHVLSLFTGTAKAATVDTKEVEHSPGRRSKLLRVRPLVDGITTSIAVGYRNDTADTVAFKTAVPQNSTGDCPVRSDARYHRYRITTAGGDFDHIRGVEVLEVYPSSQR